MSVSQLSSIVEWSCICRLQYVAFCLNPTHISAETHMSRHPVTEGDLCVWFKKLQSGRIFLAAKPLMMVRIVCLYDADDKQIRGEDIRFTVFAVVCPCVCTGLFYVPCTH